MAVFLFWCSTNPSESPRSISNSGLENVWFPFQSLTDRRNASILGFTCLLAGEDHGNLQSICPEFKISHRSSQRLHGFDPASHLRFQNPCNFRTLDQFRCSWQAAIIDLWDSIPPDILLQGHTNGWRSVLQDIQRCIMAVKYM